MSIFSELEILQKAVQTAEEAYNRGYGSQQAYLDALNDARVGIVGHTARMRESMSQLGTSVLGLGSAMVEGKEGAAVYNQSVNSATNVVAVVLEQIPLVGGLLGGLVKAAGAYVGAVNEQSDGLYAGYKKISRIGATGAQGMTGVFSNLQKFGYTMKEMDNLTGLLSQNSDQLAQIGGTVAEGTKQFANMSDSIRSSDAGTRFKEMGITVDSMNAGIAGYLRIQTMTGRAQAMTQDQLIQGATAYIQEQDRLTKLTGLSSDAQLKAQQDALSNQRYAAKIYELQQAGDTASLEKAKQLNELQTQLVDVAPEVRKGILDAAGGYSSPEANQLMRAMPNAYARLQSGTMTADAFLKDAVSDLKTTLPGMVGIAKSGDANKALINFTDLVRLEGLQRKQDLGKDTKQAEAEQDIKDPATKQMVQLTTSQRNTTMAAEKLISIGIDPVNKAINGPLADMLDTASSIPGKVAPSVAAQGTTQASTPAAYTAATTASTGASGAVSSGKGKINLAGGPTGDQAAFNALNPKVKKSFMDMVAAIGAPITVNSAKRSTADQERLYNAWLKAGGSAQNPVVNTEYGRVKMPAKPGTSLHEQGKALDLDDSSFARISGMLSAYGFGTVRGDPGHIQMPQAATGGILSGPKGGYNAMLHGTEAVVPLPNGKSIPVQTSANKGLTRQRLAMMAAHISKLDALVYEIEKQNKIQNHILRETH